MPITGWSTSSYYPKCPECKLEKCLCPVIDSAVGKAQAIDEVTREMGPVEFAQMWMDSKELELMRKNLFSHINPDSTPKALRMVKARRVDRWERLRRKLGPHSVIAIAWKRRLTKYDKRFLRGCGVKP